MAQNTRIPDHIINWDILNEIVSMDEDDAGFSQSLLIQFFEQAQSTFEKMEEHINTDKNLDQLGQLGHFLKGSSASLGLQRIAWVCERIQNYGQKKEGPGISDEQYLQLIKQCLALSQTEFALAKEELGKFYNTKF
ncbi:Phosphorelay intermediate protein YPD1 [Kluyveromyces marxianus]|uniref:Phosphorelay intermediate protein YPD1 n=2 Tax=Kluyveromyces marxianus TaxID=4911 RepID=W0TCV9_KLUMD|nr:phosphorelay intermediate protein YPD1 [Kluyveromyces marxianus DMKU3-1042]QGN16966.1 phosphorelay intermediate protein YPD1 [Kluyveromyces marxianus]BAO41260.1 phosphorelay intermediate protein YPD1 [Kluyveromyces marxianus DMKU3-1042]BAP72707.1 phosphorelay intermediate protein YPD1 [Kluyveromyces marxianus]